MDGKAKEKCAERVGLLGGSFNPIHCGHLLLARTAYVQEKLDRVVLIPCGQPYRKDPAELAPKENRLHMAELAAEGHSWLSVSDIETRRRGNTYTCDTLSQLVAEYPDRHFFFILGADCLYTMEHWKEPQVIFQNCTLVAAARAGMDTEALMRRRKELINRYGAEIDLLVFPKIPVSATQIRGRIKKGRSIRYLVPDAVCRYIEENHMYNGAFYESSRY